MKKSSQEKLTADLTELNTQLGKIDAELNQLESRASRDYELRKILLIITKNYLLILPNFLIVSDIN